MEADRQLVEYAKLIAKFQNHPVDETGLQDMPTLQAKLEHEEQEFQEALAPKNLLKILHEAADRLYYSACISARMQARANAGEHIPTPDYQYVTTLQHVQRALWSNGYWLNKPQIEHAALVKYQWRSGEPNRKNEAHELNLIWADLQHQYMLEQAPIRARWLDESLSPEERERAHHELLEVVDKYTKWCPPLTGTFTYTEEQAKEAKEHGF